MYALVIDDAKAVRMVLRSILAAEGFDVAEASSGRDGLAEFRRHKFDLILVDSYMPQMDGIEVIRELRAAGENNQLRVILVTSEDDPSRLDAALAAGADAHLPKPFTAAMVREILDLIGMTPSRS